MVKPTPTETQVHPQPAAGPKKLTVKPAKQVEAFLGWFVAETEEKWSSRIHVIEEGTKTRPKKCACQVTFEGSRIKTFTDLKDAPEESKICANCFRQLSADMWKEVITKHAELVPQAWAKLTGK